MNLVNIKLSLFLILLVSFSVISCAQTNIEIIPKSYIAYHTTSELKIDGEGNEADWNKVAWSTSFIDIEGIKKPTYNTKVKMLWDENYYYILVKLEEPHVWGNIKQHDAVIFHNNDFEVFIDPDGDSHNYYEFEMNALNTTWDLFITKPYRESNNQILNDWNITGLKSAVKVNGTLNNPTDIDEGWTIELAFPWTAYKTSYYQKNVPIDNFWRVNFSRVNWDFQIKNGNYERKKDATGNYLSEYNWVWSPQGVIDMHRPETWGYVYFSSKKAGEIDKFEIPRDEKIKWKLFELHRAQKSYYKEHNTYALSIDNLKTSAIVVEHKTLKPILENHSTGYNITLISPFSNKTIIIKEDGKIIVK